MAIVHYIYIELQMTKSTQHNISCLFIVYGFHHLRPHQVVSHLMLVFKDIFYIARDN